MTGSIELEVIGDSSQPLRRKIPYNATNSLSLIIRLRMIRCGHVQSGPKYREDGSPKLACEARVAIRDDLPAAT